MKIKIALAQINPTIADTIGNTKLIINSLKQAEKQNANIVAFPEMAIIGYPAQDLLFQKPLIYSNLKALDEIIPHTKNFSAVIIGYCKPVNLKQYKNINNTQTQSLYNSYALFSYGKLIGTGNKICLPNYGIFDDSRYFIPGKKTKTFTIPLQKLPPNNKIKIGIEICEDIWYQNNDSTHPIYPLKPTQKLAEQNADIIFVINASPFEIDKLNTKMNIVKNQALNNQIPIFYVNMWGANDKVIFDGNSFGVDKNGNIICKAKSFQYDLLTYSLNTKSKTGKPITKKYISKQENIFNALVLGKKDYHKKCSIPNSIIGVSGGIDSALVLAIDVNAISAKNVLAIISPSRYTSKESLNDAVTLCKNFRVKYKIIPIEEKINNVWTGVIPEKYKRFIKYYNKPKKNIVFENMQAIDRMSILRAIANEENRLVSGTGNKTELAVGYATVCGDLQADILVIGDLYKKQVYSLAKYINKLYKKNIIPQTIINRTPSAELAQNQIDPFNYEKLDLFVKLKIEQFLTNNEILKYKIKTSPHKKESNPFSKTEIELFSKLISINEHKRFKSGYILKVSSIAFGEDRRINTAKNISFL